MTWNNKIRMWLFIVSTVFTGAMMSFAQTTTSGGETAANGSQASAEANPASIEPTAQEKELAANLEKAQRTLEYGIDSSVISVINQSKKNKDKRLSSSIAKTFDSINPEVQKAAIDYFITLQDYSPHTRVVNMLGNFNDYQVEVVAKLLKFLHDEKMPADTVLMENLVQMSQSSKVDIQAPAIDAIAACGSEAQVEGLIKLFKKTGTATIARSAILRAMGKYPSVETTKLLKDVIGDSGEEKVLRYEALAALGKQGQVENLAAIQPSLTSTDVFERGAAINALSGFPVTNTLPLYRQALRDGMWRNRVGVLKIVNEKKLIELEAAVMFVAEEDPEKPVKTEALRTLSVLNGSAGWTLMERMFKEIKTGDEIRGLLAELLISKHFGPSIEVIRGVFSEEFVKERSWLNEVICRELAGLKDPGAASFYEKMLGHANFIIQIYGVRGIKENSLLTFHPRLEEMLKAKPAAALKASLEDALK